MGTRVEPAEMEEMTILMAIIIIIILSTYDQYIIDNDVTEVIFIRIIDQSSVHVFNK